jgi:hypothetical protein
MKPTFHSVTSRALDVLGLSSKSRQQKKHRTLTSAEYWVYLPKPELPPQDTVMTLLFDTRAIGPAEGLVFSDIRLQTVLVLRAKNQRLFRKDLIIESAGYSDEILDAVSLCQSLVRISFHSEEPVDTDTHLRFLPQLAIAIAELGEAPVIFDLTQQRLFTTETFQNSVKGAKSPADCDLHVRVQWYPIDKPGSVPHAVTHGLHKRGLPDLTTGPMEPDSQNLATHLLTEAASVLWQNPQIAYQLPQTHDVEYFGQEFKFSFERRTNDGKLLVRLFRNVGKPGVTGP